MEKQETQHVYAECIRAHTSLESRIGAAQSAGKTDSRSRHFEIYVFNEFYLVEKRFSFDV